MRYYLIMYMLGSGPENADFAFKTTRTRCGYFKTAKTRNALTYRTMVDQNALWVLHLNHFALWVVGDFKHPIPEIQAKLIKIHLGKNDPL